MFVQLALMAAQMYLAEVTRTRPKRVSFDEFKKSNAPSELRAIPYAGGTFELTPSRIWYGDFKQRAVERDSQWTDYLFFGVGLAALLDTITVGYRYYCAEAFSLCYGPDTHIEAIKIADKGVWSDETRPDNAGGGFLIDFPTVWGGDQPPGEGGQYSWVDITRGNYSDPTNAYLEQMLVDAPNKCPALRGVSCLVSRGPSGFTESGYFAAGGVGFNPKFKEWKVTGRRQPNNLGTDYSKIGRHMNPMETIYEWATNPDYGAELPVSEINLNSLRAAAQTLHSEGLGWSGKIEDATSPLDVANDVAAQVDAVLDPSPSLGWTVRLIRRDYSIGSLPVLNRDVITKIHSFTTGTYDDTFNKVIIPYPDQNNNFAGRPALAIDPANLIIQGGRVKSITQDYLGVGDATIGNKLVTRDSRALSIPMAALACDVTPSFGRLRYRGEVLKFEWNQPTFSKVMRVLSVSPGTTKEPDYSLRLTEDKFATGARTFGEPSGTNHEDPATGLDTAPPDVTIDSITLNRILTTTNQFQAAITIEFTFGVYSPGGQYARLYVTEPGGVQTLSPLYQSPDGDNEGTFVWPALATGVYEFCIVTYSLHNVSSGNQVCGSIDVSAVGSPSMSPSASASISPSSSVSPSASVSPSPSASVSPSASTSPSPSASISPSSTPSTSPSASASVSPSVSPSASQSPSASVSPSASMSPSASVSPSAGPVDDPPGVSPSDLSGLELWLKANAITGLAEDDEISTWPDSSGNGRDATGVAQSGIPTLKPRWQSATGPNSFPAVLMSHFDVPSGFTTGGIFTLPDFLTGFGAGDAFVVVKLEHDPPSSTGRAAPVLGDWGTASDGYFPFSGDGNIYSAFGTTARKNGIATIANLTSYCLYEERSASGAWSNHQNGTQLFSTGTNTVAWSTTPYIGHTVVNNKLLNGLVAEVIFFSRVLTSSERFDTIHTYLNNKYALGLPTS